MVRGIGPKTARQLLAHVDGIRQFWAMGPSGWKQIEGVRPKLLSALVAMDGAQADAVVRRCCENGLHLISPEDAAYPEQLHMNDDAPLTLFAKGELTALQGGRMLAVVGARKASREGRVIARRWSRYLAERGVTVISGMAYGIDAAAHGGALDGKGVTVAVLGSGLLAAHGEQQQRQIEAIAAAGCVVSEYLPDMEARAEFFPSRNRIIAGLAHATLVVEADIRSGSLITANLACGYGRDVLAVPGSVLNQTHAGCHHLIRQGAMLAESGEDLLQQLGWAAAMKRNAMRAFESENPHEQAVVALLERETAHLDLISEHCGLTVSELSPILLALELQGVIERLPGSRYTLGGG